MSEFQEFINKDNSWLVTDSPYGGVLGLYRFSGRFRTDDIKSLCIEAHKGMYMVIVNGCLRKGFVQEKRLVEYLQTVVDINNRIALDESVAKKESRLLRTVYSDNDEEVSSFISLISGDDFNSKDYGLYYDILRKLCFDYKTLHMFVKDLVKVVERKSGKSLDYVLTKARIYRIVAQAEDKKGDLGVGDYRPKALAFYNAYYNSIKDGYGLIAHYVFDHVSIDTIDFDQKIDSLKVVLGSHGGSVKKVAEDLMLSYYAFFDNKVSLGDHSLEYFKDKVNTLLSWSGLQEGFMYYGDMISEFADASPDKVWKKEEIRDMLATNDKAVLRAIKVLYMLQTDDEKTTDTTKYHNKVGLSAVDAVFISSLARQLERQGRLSPKQILYARKALLKYAGQLTKVANKKIRVPENVIIKE